MNLPTWTDCEAKLSAGQALDPIERFVFDNEPAVPGDAAWRQQLETAIAFALMPRMKGDTTAAPRATKKVASIPPAVAPILDNTGQVHPHDRQRALDTLGNHLVAGEDRYEAAGAVRGENWPMEMYKMGPLPAVGINERRIAGRSYGPDGKPADIVTFTNPRGDVIAARMSRLTGAIHYVDVKDGEVKSMAALPTAAVISAAEVSTEKYDVNAGIAAAAAALKSGQIVGEAVKPA